MSRNDGQRLVDWLAGSRRKALKRIGKVYHPEMGAILLGNDLQLPRIAGLSASNTCLDIYAR